MSDSKNIEDNLLYEIIKTSIQKSFDWKDV